MNKDKLNSQLRLAVVGFAFIVLGVVLGQLLGSAQESIYFDLRFYIISLVGVIVLALAIYQIYVDLRTEKYGEFCYARIKNIKIYIDQKSGSKSAEVLMDVYLPDKKDVIEFKEMALLEEIKGCEEGDYIAIKYYRNDINIKYKVVDPKSINESIRKKLGANIAYKESASDESAEEYLSEVEDDQSIIPEEGFGYELGNERELETKEYKIREEKRFYEMIDQMKAEKKKKKTAVLITLIAALALYVVIALFCYL